MFTRRFATALRHPSTSRISIKEHIPACSTGENHKMRQPRGHIIFKRNNFQSGAMAVYLCRSATTVLYSIYSRSWRGTGIIFRPSPTQPNEHASLGFGRFRAPSNAIQACAAFVFTRNLQAPPRQSCVRGTRYCFMIRRSLTTLHISHHKQAELGGLQAPLAHTDAAATS